MTPRDIVHNYLVYHQYDGMANVWQECGCGVDDLWPCKAPVLVGMHACKPGYRWTCPEQEHDCSAVEDGEFCEAHPHGCYQPKVQP